jgi:hypothetical protein
MGGSARQWQALAAVMVQCAIFQTQLNPIFGILLQPNVAPEISLLCKRVNCELVDVHLLV